MKLATIHFDGGGLSPGPVTAACTVQLSDGRGRTFETITPEAMKSARKVKETNLKWKWTDQEPSDRD